MRSCLLRELGGIITSKQLERWDCIFVDRIELDGRIYLTQPQEYGFMYTRHGPANMDVKVRKSIPTLCGQIEGSSNVNKMLKAIAISTALNRQCLKSSHGLVVRGFEDKHGLSLQSIMPPRINGGVTGRIEGTTGWIAYVSPEERFYFIDGKYKSDELPEKQSELIRGCIEDIQNN